MMGSGRCVVKNELAYLLSASADYVFSQYLSAELCTWLHLYFG